jgi:hypothetical protein
MPAPWLAAAFKAISWRDAIAAAPVIVDATRKLWNSVARTEKRAAPDEAQSTKPAASSGDGVSAIEARVAALEAKTAEMAREAVASAELIKSLAEQSSQLVKAVEILRVRTRRLIAFSFLVGLATAFLLLWVIFQR